MIKKSPIYYTGNKYKLLSQIDKYFPNKINTFYDIFGGSGTVSMNMVARSQKVVYNEFDKYVFNLFNFYQTTNPEDIDTWTRNNAELFNLPIGSNDYQLSDEELAKYKESFTNMQQTFYDDDKTKPFFHHMLKQYSFSNTLTFNKDGFIKVGFGNRYYKPDVMLKNMYNLYNAGIETNNGSFVDFIDKEFNEDDFIYVDPPYWNTNANYNDGWTWELEMMLLGWLDKLNKNGIKWAISNVFEHKGKVNKHLVEWAENNGYFVFKPHIQYAAMGSGTQEQEDTVEVFITNYDPVGVGDYTEQLSLF